MEQEDNSDIDTVDRMALAQSLNLADSNIEKLIHDICQKKWEQEVIEKKGKTENARWIFAKAQECQILKPDPNLVGTEYDQDGEDEPAPGRADWYQTDKARIKIRYRSITNVKAPMQKTMSASSGRLSKYRLQNYQSGAGKHAATTTFESQKLNATEKPSATHLQQLISVGMNNQTTVKGQSQRKMSKLIHLQPKGGIGVNIMSSSFEQNIERKSPKIVTDLLRDDEIESDDQPREPVSAMFRPQKTSLISPKKKNSSSAMAKDPNSRGSMISQDSFKGVTQKKKDNSFSKAMSSYRDDESSYSGQSITKRASRRRRLIHSKKPKVEQYKPKVIPLPKTEEMVQQEVTDEEFYNSCHDMRVYLRVKGMIQERKDNTMKKRMENTVIDPLYPIEVLYETEQPVNVEKLQKMPTIDIQAKVDHGFHRVPMKQKTSLTNTIGNSFYEQSSMSILNKNQIAAQQPSGLKEPSPVSAIKINRDTKLLEVLAEEFDHDGRITDVDVNGFKQIDGLDLQRNANSKTGNSRQTARSSNLNNDQISSLSALQNIKIAPGVIFKEFKNDAKRQVVTSDFTKISGGDFKPSNRVRSGSKSSKQMSTRQYQQLSGIRLYDIKAKQALAITKQQSQEGIEKDTNSENHIKMMQTNLAEEDDEAVSISKPNNLFARNRFSSDQSRFNKGQITFNLALKSSLNGTEKRSTLDQKNYLRNMMHIQNHNKTSRLQSDYVSNNSYSIPQSQKSMNRGARIQDQNMSQRSMIPIEHSYATVTDIKMNAKVKTSRYKDAGNSNASLNSLGELDNINNWAGVASINASMKKNNQFARTTGNFGKMPQSSTANNPSSIRTRAQTTAQTSRAHISGPTSAKQTSRYNSTARGVGGQRYGTALTVRESYNYGGSSTRASMQNMTRR